MIYNRDVITKTTKGICAVAPAVRNVKDIDRG